MQWVMFQMGHIGPMLGQAHHFLGYAPEKIEYAMNRYRNEANRLYGVVENRLEENEWLACDEYTIADMATMPWLRFPERQGVNIDDYPRAQEVARRIAAAPGGEEGAGGAGRPRRPRRQISKEQSGGPFRRHAICQTVVLEG